MNLVYIGDIVNTHGIKGEVRIISDFKYKKLIFKKDFKLYVDNEILIINSYRYHKIFDMITFQEFSNINEVLKYKGKKVYINKDDIEEKVVLNEDYIGLEVYGKEFIGTITEVMKSVAQDILVVKNEKKTYLIPNVEEFVKEIDLINRKIYINEIKGLIDEN